jgi:hypothetical protein
MSSFAKERFRPYYLKWFYSRAFPERYPPEVSLCWDDPGHPLYSNLSRSVGDDWLGDKGMGGEHVRSDMLLAG